jgi:hypothetical protein
MEGLRVVRQSQVKTIGKYPRGGVFSTQGEFLLLENEFRRIVVLRLDTWTEVFRIVLNQVASEAIWYMPSKDGIILLQRDLETAELTFVLFLNWRVADPRNPKCSVAPAAKKPNNWRFEPQESGFHSFALGCFSPNSSVVAQVHESSIVIVSESMALFWDISDRPVFRFILLLPPPLARPTFAFLGDRLAIVTQGTLLILQTVAGAATVLTEPFSPGSKCFELRETLVPHFGVTQDNVNANSLFIVRYLPDRPVTVQILYEWRPPGDPRALAFIPPANTLLILTSLGVFACRVGSGDPGAPNYLPEQLSFFQGATRIDFNRDFLILADASNLSIFPNPEKSGLQFGDSFEVLEKVTYRNILFVATNVEFCVVVTGAPGDRGHQKADDEAAIYVLKFDDVGALARRLSGAADLSAKRAGLRLKTPSDRDFADQVYTIGLHLLTSPAELANGISYLARAFNAGVPEAQRATILAEVLRQRPTARRAFIREAAFRGDELDDALMRAVLALPPREAIRKLIQAKRFDRAADFGDIPEAALFRAIAAALAGDHAAARALFAAVAPALLLKLLDEELLCAVSEDLSPQTLIAIGRPELANSQWSAEERHAAFHFAGGRLEAALDIAAQNLAADWHFAEWPARPTLVDWVDGSAMLQFAAGCFTAHAVGRAVPDAFRNLADACSLAKERRFAEALSKVRETVYPFDFLRCFAHGPADWAAVIGQVDDPDVRRCAIHFLIASSPKKAYKAVLSRLSIPGLKEIADELRATDDALLALTAAAVGIK